MSDFSDPTKSQEKIKRNEEESTETAQHETTPAHVEQEETVEEAIPQEPLTEEPSLNDSSEEVTDVRTSSSEYIEQPEGTEKTKTPETDSETDETPLSEQSSASETDNYQGSEDNSLSESEETPASEQREDFETTTDAKAADDTPDAETADTDDELIVAATASKVSGRFVRKQTENIRPESESVTAEETTPQQDTISAEVPPQSRQKKKKEKKPKEPLPDVAPESKILNSLSLLPWLTLLIFAALQGGIALFFRDLWPIQEAQTAAVVKDTLAASNWLTPMLDGKPYSGAMPLYFWFSSAVALIPDIALNFLVKASTVLSSMLFVLSTYIFARAVGVSKKTSLAAGLLTIAAFIPAISMQLNGLETLFAAFVTLSHAAFVMGWKRERSLLWLPLGFICVAAATLTGGFPGLILPLFSILFISLWRKRPTRFGEWDVACGFGIFLIIVLSWFTYVNFAVQPEYLLNLVPNILSAPFKGALAHLPYWWHMLAMLPFMLLPWLIVVLVLPWTKLFSIVFYKNILATRNPENIGVAYLWLSAVLSCALYSVLDYMTPVWLLVLLPQIAILAARAIKNFSPLRSKIFYRLHALIFLAAGAGLIGLVNFTQLIPFEIHGWMYLSAILLATAGLFWLRSPLNSRLGIVGLALVMTILLQPLLIMSAPAINSFISIKDISMTMEEYAEKDFVPVVYNTDPAPFAYFVNKPVTHVFDPHSLSTVLNTNKNVVLIMSATDWDNWLTKPESLKLVGTQGAAIPHLGKGFILAVQEKRASRYGTPEVKEPQDETTPPKSQEPAVEEPEPTPPAKDEPALDAPQTDNEEEPAPLGEPLNDNSTTATSEAVQQETALTLPITPELTAPANQ
ncbi:ArnT family glycosyltransferase [Halodesulfovibrio marinisediminis]|uniref:4-amino-4-deoxy-L-arabinose transferase n=1 Tax=Halodesulfovibrio marinisediminis DSM 17456 TaxID=1121457 RepID=A0A1N6DGV5_9BACT|nr:glycosyltransferase family 39 protein [Halodesulfovibrio marinisediminis]SIN70022.1 4-amino-4-deoxy-L-arabinose transferase [Halodesulfovibrio marinisediminis DSM 17456]